MRVFSYNVQLPDGGNTLHYMGVYGTWATSARNGRRYRLNDNMPRGFRTRKGKRSKGYMEMGAGLKKVAYPDPTFPDFPLAGHVDTKGLPQPESRTRGRPKKDASKTPAKPKKRVAKPKAPEKTKKAASQKDEVKIPYIQQHYPKRRGYMLVEAMQHHSKTGKVYANCGEFGVWSREYGAEEWGFERESWCAAYGQLKFMGAWAIQIPSDSIRRRVYRCYDPDRRLMGFTDAEIAQALESTGLLPMRSVDEYLSHLNSDSTNS